MQVPTLDIKKLAHKYFTSKSVPQLKLGWKYQPNLHLLSDLVSSKGCNWKHFEPAVRQLDAQLEEAGLDINHCYTEGE